MIDLKPYETDGDLDDTPVYSFDLMKVSFGSSWERIEGGFWVFKEGDPAGWMKFTFMEFYTSEGASDENIKLIHVMSSEGPSGGLRECRHTIFGPEQDGYVFYMSRKKMEAALNYLSTYFDLD